MTPELFETTEPTSAGTVQDSACGAPRVLTADRRQLQWRTCDLESTRPAASPRRHAATPPTALQQEGREVPVAG